MKIVIQRSQKSFVKVKEKTVSQIPFGLVLLVCLEKEDSEKTLIQILRKTLLELEEKLAKNMANHFVVTAGKVA